MSQGELAKRAKVSREYLNRLESGKYDPTLGTLTRLSRALGVTLMALLGGAGEGG
jgi:transcriptional regulator with XRE-family HTH domain